MIKKSILIAIAVVVLGAGVVLLIRPPQDAVTNTQQVAASHVAWEPEQGSTDYEKPNDGQLRDMLTPLQYAVTQEEDTERPFSNAYWDNKKPGLYVDIVSGEPLFSSIDKFASGTGWPSFTRPLVAENVEERVEEGLWGRTEVHSRLAKSHLGHVFGDGPEPTGLRYCINSASLRFVPVDQLEEAGYGQYLELFEAKPAGSEAEE